MKKSNEENFISKSIEKHGHKCDYSLVEYINNNTKVKIICQIHGIFEQIPRTHLNGRAHGCGKCANNDYRYTIEDFVKRAGIIYNNKYDYSLIKHVNRRSHINIICPMHGIFKTRADIHLEGAECIKCNQEKRFALSENKFIEKSKIVHKCLYDYALVKYNGANVKTEIICSVHGSFFQTPSGHSRGKGCPYCKESKGEIKIKNFLQENSLVFMREHRFPDCKYKNTLPFDFYIPKLNLCIEFNGKQHYKPIKHFGGQNYLELTQKRDKIKFEYCKKNKIKLLTIKYNDNVYNILTRYLLL